MSEILLNNHLTEQLRYVTDRLDITALEYYGANGLPTERAVENTKSILKLLFSEGVNLNKAAIRCSGLGGVVLFPNDSKKSFIECLNDGEIHFFQGVDK